MGFRVGRLAGVAAILCGSLVASCAYQPGDEGNPFTRKFTWFSFIAGDDVRAACRPGAPDRFRLIYNGNWTEQVRIYEVRDGSAPVLEQRIIGAGSVTGLSFSDPLAPWRGVTASAPIPPDEYAGFLRSLVQSRAYASPEDTLTLRSDGFYWTVASCHDGVFHLAAWLYPSDAFSHATFPAWLVAFDRTGVAINPPPSPGQSNPDASEHPQYDRTSGPDRGAAERLPWSIGIAHDRLVDEVVF